MLRLFRARVWCLATALALTLGTTTASFEALLHVDGAHDDACAATFAGPHDASAHRIRAASPDHDGAATHCLACHWARSFRFFTASVPAPPNVDEPGTPRLASNFAPTVAPALANLAPRSPPAVA